MSKIIPTPRWIFSDWCCACGTNESQVHKYYYKGTDYWTEKEVETDIDLCEDCAKRISKKIICERFFFMPDKKMKLYYKGNNNEEIVVWEGIPCSD